MWKSGAGPWGARLSRPQGAVDTEGRFPQADCAEKGRAFFHRQVVLFPQAAVDGLELVVDRLGDIADVVRKRAARGGGYGAGGGRGEDGELLRV